MLAAVPGAGICVLSFTSLQQNTSVDWTGDTYVYKALAELGDTKPDFYIDEPDSVLVQKGYELVHHGRTEDPEGGQSKYISIYYVCTNCHNTVIEDPVLTDYDPEARLDYAVKHDLPFLQATTFYGIVNRESWYNDDYYKKYGDLVKPAQKDVRQAIELCAKECSKGRYLSDWEENAILQYYYSISYTLHDLHFTDAEISSMNKRKNNTANHTELIKTIKSRYGLKSPAHWLEPPYDKGSDIAQGDPAIGKEIFERSCQQCHKPYGVSDVVFEDSKLQFNHFSKDFDKDYWWLYSIVRHGTYGYAGHEPYMPLYTAERMSDAQVEDLKAYFMQQAQ